MQTLIDRAIAEHMTLRERAMEEEARRRAEWFALGRKEAVDEFRRAFGLEDAGAFFESFEGDPRHPGKFYFEGVRYYHYGHGWFAFEGECPGCGEETWSRAFQNLEQLGALLGEFQVDPGEHACRHEVLQGMAEEQPRTWQYWISEAIRQAVEEALGDRE